jgi:hypothetical protein
MPCSLQVSQQPTVSEVAFQLGSPANLCIGVKGAQLFEQYTLLRRGAVSTEESSRFFQSLLGPTAFASESAAWRLHVIPPSFIFFGAQHAIHGKSATHESAAMRYALAYPYMIPHMRPDLNSRDILVDIGDIYIEACTGI